VVEQNRFGQEFVLIPPGEFTMGTTAEQGAAVRKYDSGYKEEWLKWEQPARRVRLTEPWQLEKHLVTVDDFGRFVKATGYQTEAERSGKGSRVWNGKEWVWDSQANWRNPGFEQQGNHPVVCVSHNDGMRYIEWLNREDTGYQYRLPTEAEWEYSARGGTETWHFGGDDPEGLVRIANVADKSYAARYPGWKHVAGDDGFVYTSPVGRFAPNALGLHDMLGNALQWCGDWWDEKYYATGPGVDPQGPAKGVYRVFRGASWFVSPSGARCANRGGDAPGGRVSDLGLRLLRVPKR